MNSLARVSKDTVLKEKVKEVETLIKEKMQVEAKYSILGDLKDLYLKVYADAAFGNLENKMSSTKGAIIMLRGMGARCSLIYWR